MIGKTVSHYKIVEELGRGGMGVLYKAKNTRLGTTVALKFLPPELTSDKNAKKRFMFEAQAASSLDHQNICTIHDIDESDDGQLFISMVYYAGLTLKEKIAAGPIRPERAVEYATRIARGLSKAHEKKIHHRDIKPSNICFTEDGQVKIVDFGLAKLVGQARLTKPDRALGTITYMSPEQARGDEVDHRTDIWSLGVVLYEMLAGRPPFHGEFEQATIYSILNEPHRPASEVCADIPAELEVVVNRALQKNPGDRYRDVDEMLAELVAIGRRMDISFSTDATRLVVSLRRRRRIFGFAIAALVVAIAAVALIGTRKMGAPGLPPLGQPRRITVGEGWEGDPSISPDGWHVAYAGDESGNMEIYVVDVRGGEPLRLTDNPARDQQPTWLPDGSSIAFVSDRGGSFGIWKVGHLGGTPLLILADASDPAISPDGKTLAFVRDDGEPRIGVTSLDGPAEITMLTGEGDGLWAHRDPAWSPDGKRLCYSTYYNNLWIVPLEGGRPRPLTAEGGGDADPSWSPGGERIYFSSYREGTHALWFVSLADGDLHRLTVGSGPESQPCVSVDGSLLAYSTVSMPRDLVLQDRGSGEETTLPGASGASQVSVSPDASCVVYCLDRWGGKSDLWMQALDGFDSVDPPQRLTDHPGNAAHCEISPDGDWVVYYRVTESGKDVWIVPSTGGQPKRFTDDPADDYHPSWSPDGERIVFVSHREGGPRIYIAPFEAGRRAGPPWRLEGVDVASFAPSWSHDGKWIAFIGLHEGLWEAWVAPVDGDSPPRPVTEGIGVVRIRWESPDVLLASGNTEDGRVALFRVPLDGTISEIADPPVDFGIGGAQACFDITPDGNTVAYLREGRMKGDVWVLEAKQGSY